MRTPWTRPAGVAQCLPTPALGGCRLGDEASRPANLASVAFSPVTGWDGPHHAASTVYAAERGAPVFKDGTIQWSWSLDGYGHEEIGRYAGARLQAVTKNVLDALPGPRRDTSKDRRRGQRPPSAGT